jgi:hypothetical protein
MFCPGLDLVEFVAHDIAFVDQLGSLYLYCAFEDELLILVRCQLEDGLLGWVVFQIQVHQVALRLPESNLLELLLQLVRD